MEGKSLLLILVVFVTAGSSNYLASIQQIVQGFIERTSPCQRVPIDQSLPSTACIALRTCSRNRNEATAKNFYDCYSVLDATEKQIFLDCQKQAFGYELSTKSNLRRLCLGGFLNLGRYATCLRQKFGNQATQDAAVRKVNQCQGKAVNLVPASN